MTRDEKIYFSLLRIGLGTESPREILPELAKLQWGEIYRLAVRQGTGAGGIDLGCFAAIACNGIFTIVFACAMGL